MEFLEKVKGFFVKVGSAIKSFFVDKVAPTAVKVWKVSSTWVKTTWGKFVAWVKETTKDIKWKDVWDKCTTGLLILLMASPILILGYIFLWFILR